MDEHHKLLLASLLSLIVVLALACGAASTGGEGAVPTAQTEDAGPSVDLSVIRIANTGAGYEAIAVPVFEFIMKEGYGYDVETVSMTVSEMKAALIRGEVQVSLAAMTPETKEWFDAEVAAGSIVDRGILYEDDGVTYGKAVHPSLEVAYPDVFKMLQRMNFKLKDLVGVAEWADENDVSDPVALAANYLGTIKFEDRWKQWIPNAKFRLVNDFLDQNYSEYNTCRFHCPYKEHTKDTKKTASD